MNTAVRTLASLAILGCVVALLAPSRQVCAQNDSNQPVLPKSSSADDSDPNFLDTAPAASQRLKSVQTTHDANARAGSNYRSQASNDGTSFDPRSRTSSSGALPAKNTAPNYYNGYNQPHPAKPLSSNNAAVQTSFQSNGQNLQSDQNAAGGSVPGYQQPPRGNPSGNTPTLSTLGSQFQRSQQSGTSSKNAPKSNSQPNTLSAQRMQTNNMSPGYQKAGNMPSDHQQSNNYSFAKYQEYQQSDNDQTKYQQVTNTPPKYAPATSAPRYTAPTPMPSRNLQASMQTTSTPGSVMSSNNSPGSVMYSPATPGAVVSGPMSMSSATPRPRSMSNMPGVAHQPMVTPNAVYLDAAIPVETIGPGQPRAGSHVMYGSAPGSPMMQSGPPMAESGEMISLGLAPGTESMTMDPEAPMERGPMMDHSPDGFTNPYCNSCNGCGGGCGCGGSWLGSTCGGGCCNGGNCGCGSDGGCCDCDSCGSCGEHAPYGRPWVLAPLDWFAGEVNGCHNDWWWGEDLTVFAGVQDFKNIADGGLISSFGFQEGVNWGLPVLPDLGINGQVGYEATQSEFENIDGSRQQSFVTAGVFHRSWCDQGWDAGIMFDWLHDDFFSDSFDICQIRGQLGWQWNRCNEIGFWFATSVANTSDFQTLDQYNFFYRRQFCTGGDVRFWGGFTGGNRSSTSGGLFGADFQAPLSKRWALDGGFNYFIPSARAGNGGFSEESWNLGFNLVWYLGGTAQCYSPYRPLFNVADNGSLMTISR